jgi:RNA polymerase sigma factor (sigma-70 family)
MSFHRGKTRGLGSTPEATLFHQAQSGNPQALNRLMAHHDRLVHAIIRRHGLGPLSYADTLQAGRLGLWRAILKYDPSRGWAFSTYAWPSIMRSILRTVKLETRPVCDAFALHHAFLRETADPARLTEDQVIPQAVQTLIRRLPASLQHAIGAHYGFARERPASFAQIGRQLGVSEERARQLHQEALIWLRQPAHSQSLRTLLGRHTRADYQALSTLNHRWWRSERGPHGD